jgi:trk system potassium uptake protein TrkH
MVFATSLLIISLDNQSFATNFSAVTATINNIGPGLDAVGPTANYAFFSPLSKITLIFNMFSLYYYNMLFGQKKAPVSKK